MIFCGMPFSGKSSIAQKVAETLSLPFIDTDTLFEKPPRLLFQELGEEAFRKREREILYGLNLETAFRDGKVIQDFELESFRMGGDHSQKVKAPLIVNNSNSKDCVNLPSITAVSGLKGGVIALGGGSFYYQDVMTHLQSLGEIYYLSAPLDVLLARIKDCPAYLDKNDIKGSFEKLYFARTPLFERVCTKKIMTAGKRVEDIVEEIVNGK